MSRKDSKHRAGDFADWVFRRNNPWWREGRGGATSSASREFGTYAHELIENLRLWAMRSGGNAGAGAWGLEFADADGGGQIFLASRLRVGGVVVSCRPDVVLRESISGRRIIIERKTHRVRGPRGSRGWRAASYQNVWAQLWCYAQIDDWCPRVDTILISEMWNFSPYDVRPRREQRGFAEVDQEIRPLFKEYGGAVED